MVKIWISTIIVTDIWNNAHKDNRLDKKTTINWLSKAFESKFITIYNILDGLPAVRV